MLLYAAPACAQVAKGTVRDAKSGEPIPLANVVWMGTQVGTSTDADGHFSLSRKGDSSPRLVVSSVGYIADTLEAQFGTSMAVSLKPSATLLNAVEIQDRQKGSYQKMTTTQQEEVITTEGLRGLACCNLGESFENSASVDVGYSDAVSGSKQIQLLGLTGTYSQMLLENTPFLRGLPAPFGLGYVPGQWMQSISVSKGVGSVKNGYEAITGAINLEYEKPQHGDLFSLNLYENSDLKSELTAKLNYAFNDRLATGLYLFGTYNALRNDHLGHDGFMDYPLQKQFNVLNRWNYEKPGGLCSQTVINYTHEDRLGGDMRFEESMRGNDSIFGFGGQSDRLHFFTKNGFPIGRRASFGSQITATYFDQNAYYGLSTYHGTEKDLYANLLMNADVLGDCTIDFGTSVRYSDMVENLRSVPYIGAAAQHPVLMMTEVVPGVFGQFTFRWGDAFNATAGLRYDYNSLFQQHLVTPRLHFRWRLAKDFVLRGVGGRGYRTSNIIAENIGLLASSRDILFAEPLQMEDAWNTGLNLTKKFHIWHDRELSITADYYHTEFNNQVVVDLDRDPNQAWISNLDGRSYSNVLQLDLNAEVAEGFDITLAGKVNDVRCTYNGQLLAKPYTSKYKGLLVLSYHTRFSKWRFDLTTQLNGPQRLPLNVGSVQGTTDPYIYMLGQITRRFKRWECYVGVENLTDYTQDCLVIGSDAPMTQAFDASVVYAPIMGRLFYAGLRFTIK